MKFLVWLLALFAAAVALTMAAHNPGYVQFAYPPYRVEMSLTLFVIVSLLLFVAGYLLVRLFSAALQLPSQVRAFLPRWSAYEVPDSLEVRPRILWKAFLDAGSLLGLWMLLVAADGLQRAGLTPTWVTLP